MDAKVIKSFEAEINGVFPLFYSNNYKKIMVFI